MERSKGGLLCLSRRPVHAQQVGKVHFLQQCLLLAEGVDPSIWSLGIPDTYLQRWTAASTVEFNQSKNHIEYQQKVRADGQNSHECRLRSKACWCIRKDTGCDKLCQSPHV